MKRNKELEDLIALLKAGVSPFHGCRFAQEKLEEAGFAPLSLGEPWKLSWGGRYVLPVYGSSLFAFTLPKKKTAHPELYIEGAHTDWPNLRIKPSPEMDKSRYGRLNVEVYGGPIYNTWLDRPLSVAGRVALWSGEATEPKVVLYDAERPILTIPNLAIHMNREVNSGVALNAQTDLIPLCYAGDAPASAHWFMDFLAGELQVKAEDILDFELGLYPTEVPEYLGLDGQLLSSPRLDNLTSVAACLEGILTGSGKKAIRVIACYDNEEVGSRTKQGAMSAVTDRILEKIFLSLGLDRSVYLDSLTRGRLLSMDVAHAMHPNHTEKCDPLNRIYMGDGVALKMAAAQSYATDATAISVVEGICRRDKIAYKKFVNRSDMRGGSTIGALSSALLAMPTVDVGVPILAMHSARELMHSRDQLAINALARGFFAE